MRRGDHDAGRLEVNVASDHFDTRPRIFPAGELTRSVRFPALDGFRGLAVAFIVLFHLFPRVAPGGAVGLSMFFTLSGFLITTVILDNVQRNGRFSAAQFWDARARRILPAALVTTATISVLRVTTSAFPWTGPRDALATLLQYNNWHFLFPSRQDEEMLGQISGVRHMWSLAVEEQFYLGAAVLAVILTWMARDIRRSLVWIALAGMVASFAMPAIVDLRYERIFFATDTRSGEILAGVFAAALLYAQPNRKWVFDHRMPILIIATLSLVGLLYWTASADPFVIGGNRLVLPYLSALSATSVIAGTIPMGPGNAMLKTGPIMWLGLRSYGIYLYHQPIGLAFKEWLPDQSRLAHGVTVLAATFAIAELSYRWVEMPVRDRKLPVPGLTVAALAMVAIVVFCTFID